MIKRCCISLILLLLCFGVVSAQERRTEIMVDFRVNSTCIDTSYRNNAERISRLVALLKNIQADRSVRILDVSFCGAASPEGSYEWNRQLADGRLKALERLVRSKVEIPDSIITHDDSYIPWEHLAGMVRESDIRYKDEILEIIRSRAVIVEYYGERSIDSRVLRLKALAGGKVWREMLRRFFVPMRNAGVVMITLQRELPVIVPPVTALRVPDIQPLLVDSVPMPQAEGWRPNLSFKTNVPALGMAIANAAVEIDLCRRLSFNLPVYYSAWNYFSSTVKFRTLAFQPEIRYWLSACNLCNDGWFVGAHFGLAYYNIATDGGFRTQDHDGKSPALGGGLAVGCRLPIGGSRRWKMEFSIGAGAYALHYDKFHNYKNGLLVSTEKKTYIGIDQASVSFSYSFGLKRKGGAR